MDMEYNIEKFYEDDDILVIHKPSGLAAQSTQKKELSVFEYFENKYEPVNRLDQRVSGLMLLAKNAEMFKLLSSQLQEGKIIKKYKAVVANKPRKDEEELTHYLLKNHKLLKAKALNEKVANSKKAILRYKVLQSSIKYHLLEVQIDTGRFHQIRCQLGAIQSPIVGDVKYGYKRTTDDGSIFLQCSDLSFLHPKTNAEINVTIDIPDVWKKFGF